VARAATMVAEPIEGAQFIEGAQWLDGEARFIEAELPIVVDAVLPIVAVDGDGNTTDRVPRNGIRPIRWSRSSKTRRRMSERAWVIIRVRRPAVGATDRRVARLEQSHRAARGLPSRVRASARPLTAQESTMTRSYRPAVNSWGEQC
jgi:hypothetical protein